MKMCPLNFETVTLLVLLIIFVLLLQQQNDGSNMMVGPPQGGDPMVMGAMGPGMPPGLLPPPDMYMGGPPHPDFMGPPHGFPMGGPPPMFPGPPAGLPGSYPPMQHQEIPGGVQRQQRPWFRGQDGGGRGNSGGGTWRHPSKGITLFCYSEYQLIKLELKKPKTMANENLLLYETSILWNVNLINVMSTFLNNFGIQILLQCSIFEP